MGGIAVRDADHVIVTTDDPYSEDPAAITDEIVKGIRESGIQEIKEMYSVILDRKEAIEKALNMAEEGDIVLIAGRGHEKFQDFSGKKIPFDDKEVVKAMLCNKQ
jgi:UDP-N-acetylmuramoyl-L-alanyl-D-glutamate--2,6-diaminopimelate ligase